MVDWGLKIITSEFLWGIIIGAILTTYGAFLTAKINKSNHEKSVKIFCKSSLKNILKVIGSMDEYRDRSQAIHHDFIDIVELDLNVYGRNREQLTYLSNDALRQDVNDLFNDIAIFLLRIKQNLEKFYKINSITPTPEDLQNHTNQVNEYLRLAHRNCDKLVSLETRCRNIIEKL